MWQEGERPLGGVPAPPWGLAGRSERFLPARVVVSRGALQKGATLVARSGEVQIDRLTDAGSMWLVRSRRDSSIAPRYRRRHRVAEVERPVTRVVHVLDCGRTQTAYPYSVRKCGAGLPDHPTAARLRIRRAPLRRDRRRCSPPWRRGASSDVRHRSCAPNDVHCRHRREPRSGTSRGRPRLLRYECGGQSWVAPRDPQRRAHGERGGHRACASNCTDANSDCAHGLGDCRDRRACHGSGSMEGR